jgi:hypothetical protein
MLKSFPYEGPEMDDRLVVIVEDIIDSSETIIRVCDYLDDRDVAQRNICTFLFKERPENIGWRNTGLTGYHHLPEVRHVGFSLNPCLWSATGWITGNSAAMGTKSGC